ncbi:unnamed protein product [Meganyctiphanes norvegica]|uniref:Uncharacterized protein n=1 Tax=Meganyctiphanes norvegica TaxID=48144 RepID=A0AAV2R1A6_MEGNR
MIGAAIILWSGNNSLRAAIEDQRIKQRLQNLSECKSGLYDLTEETQSLHSSMEQCQVDVIGNSKDIRALAFIKGMIRNKDIAIRDFESDEIKTQVENTKFAIHEKQNYADELLNKLNILTSELKDAQYNVDSTKMELLKFQEEIKTVKKNPDSS